MCGIHGHTRCRDAVRFLGPGTEMPVQQFEAYLENKGMHCASLGPISNISEGYTMYIFFYIYTDIHKLESPQKLTGV